MPAGSAFAIVGHFFNSITDVVVQTMNTIFSARIMKRLALTTALCTAFISAAHADDLNIKTMIPGVPQIDAESYILTITPAKCSPNRTQMSAAILPA